MKNKSIVGGLLLIILLVTAVVAIWFPKLTFLHNFRNNTIIFAAFDNVGNLTKNTKVTVAGVTVGFVADIFLDYANQQAKVAVAITDNKLKLPADSIAVILSSSLLGKHYIDIRLGVVDKYLQPGQVLVHTQSAISAEDIVQNSFFKQSLFAK